MDSFKPTFVVSQNCHTNKFRSTWPYRNMTAVKTKQATLDAVNQCFPKKGGEEKARLQYSIPNLDNYFPHWNARVAFTNSWAPPLRFYFPLHYAQTITTQFRLTLFLCNAPYSTKSLTAWSVLPGFCAYYPRVPICNNVLITIPCRYSQIKMGGVYTVSQ